MKRVFSAVMLILLLTSMLILTLNIQPVKATGTIYIRADGSIDPSDAPISTADNVTYTLTGNVTSDVDGIVVEKDNIVVDGAGYTVAKDLWASEKRGNGTTLTGRSNVTVRNITIKDFNTGIYLSHSSGNVLSGNEVFWSHGDGIDLHYSSNNVLSGNNVTANWWSGIYLDWSSNNTLHGNNAAYNGGHGITLAYHSDNNTLSGNNATANRDHGIWLRDSSNTNVLSGNNLANNPKGINLYYSTDNVLSGNNVTGNEIGIWFSDSSNNVLSGNNVTGNEYGIWSLSSYSVLFGNNSILHNNFINNTQHVHIQVPGIANSWDAGYPSGGNYWSDYNGADQFNGPYQNMTGSDGKGDTPYSIDSNNVDHYPLMSPWTPLPVHNINTGLDYATIQEAINAPETLEGHIIFVETGTYYENVVVNRTVLLLGESVGTAIIDASGTGNVIDVKAKGVVIEGFTLQNSGYDASGIHIGNIIIDNVTIRNNILTNNDIGINVWDSGHNSISENNITNNYYGIVLQYSVGNTLRNNHMNGNIRNFFVWGDIPNYFYHDIDSSNTVDGKPMYYWFNQQNQTVPADAGYVALVYSSNITVQNLDLKNNGQGVLLVQTSNSTVEGNNITYNTDSVYLLFSSNNTVCENSIANSGFGLYLSDSSNNTICENNVTSNYYGIAFGNIFVPFSDNTIYHNDFINNTEQVYVLGHPSYANSWDKGYPSGGNYWSDYSGIDVYAGPYQNSTGTDGIGDTPYVIDANNVDRYPLMKPYVERLRLLGDVNGDRKVDMKDVMGAVQAFNSFPGQPRWNTNADLDNSGRVDMRDILIIVLNFNKHE